MSIYYSPKNFDCTAVASFDLHEPDYSFDIVGVWKHNETGKVYAAYDSGCSCPIPFEDHKFPTDFMEVRSWQDVKTLISQSRSEYRYRDIVPIPSHFRRAVYRVLEQ